LKFGPSSTSNNSPSVPASIAYNPKDLKIYYLWTDYASLPKPIYWRWRADTTFTSSATATTAQYLDTLRSFTYDIGGIAFDNTGGWTLEFPPAPCKRAFLRPIDFAAEFINTADTLDFIPGPGGIGDTLFSRHRNITANTLWTDVL
jgi:hypothetical protein